jgi:hypothetical protein
VPWVRFDDQFTIHRKVDGLSDAAFRLHASAIFWSARNLTDGFVSREDLDGVTARVRTPERFAAECKQRGVWHLGDEDCPSEKCPADGGGDGDGWIIHDYWEFQPSKVQVVRDREAAARRQKKWREARNPQGYPQGDTGADLHNPHIHRPKGESNASSNGVTNAVSASSPPRPERKRGGKAPPRASPPALSRGARPDDAAGQHPYKPDPAGICESCGLPETNRHHLETS